MPNIIRRVNLLPVKRERYHMCIPGQMVSCIICMRLSLGNKGPWDTQRRQCTQQGVILGMLEKLVGTHIISLGPFNNTTQGALLLAFYKRGTNLKSKTDQAISLLKMICLMLPLSLSPQTHFSLTGCALTLLPQPRTICLSNSCSSFRSSLQASLEGCPHAFRD